MIDRFQFLVSYLYYYMGDLTSRTPWFGWDPWSWKFYQFCMEESLKLDVVGRIWKYPPPKEVRRSVRRKAKKLGKRG
jgi:hypothetical protein